jgi:hypothetical protein
MCRPNHGRKPFVRRAVIHSRDLGGTGE